MGYLFLVLAQTLNATANILLKIGAGRLGDLGEPGAVARLLTNYYLLAGLAVFALNVVFYAGALTGLNLSVAYRVMVAGGIVIVVSVSGILRLARQLGAPASTLQDCVVAQCVDGARPSSLIRSARRSLAA